MNELRILGILISDRVKDAVKIQQALTKYGCSIKTRLGLHEAGEVCARNGLILIELTGKKEEWDALEKELTAIEGIAIQKMSFNL